MQGGRVWVELSLSYIGREVGSSRPDGLSREAGCCSLGSSLARVVVVSEPVSSNIINLTAVEMAVQVSTRLAC